MSDIVLFYKELVQHGGAERLHYHLYDELLKLGYKPKLIFFKLDKKLLKSYDFDPAHICVFKGSYLSKMFKFARVISKSKLVIVSSGIIDVWLASIFSKTKYIHLLHHPVFMSMTDNDKFSLLHKKYFDKVISHSAYKNEFLTKKAKLSLVCVLKLNLVSILRFFSIRAATKTFVLSSYAKDEKKQLYKIDATVNRAALCEVNKNINKKFYTDNCKLKIVSLGRLDRYKRFDVVINSIIEIKNKRNIDVQLDIIGRGPEYNNLQRIVKNNSAENFVNLHGYKTDEEVSCFFKQAHLFISIDWADFRLTSFEALNNSLPVILSNESKEDIDLIKSGWCTCVSPVQPELTKCIIEVSNKINNLNEEVLGEYLNEYTWKDYTSKVLKNVEIPK